MPVQAAEAQVWPLRTRGGGHAVYLIVERDDSPVVGIEVKLNRTVDDRYVRHLMWLRDVVGDRLVDAAVVTTGREAHGHG